MHRRASSARGPTGDSAVSHDADPSLTGSTSVTLDLRHADAPPPNAVLR
jgi:hypothetical protein